MSQFILSPAVLQRLESFSEEVSAAGHIAAYLSDFFDVRMRTIALGEIRDSLERASTQLAETLGGDESEDIEIFPLPNPEPYLMPMALDYVVAVVMRSVPVVKALAESAGETEFLALDYFAFSLAEIGVTARHLRETVREELPPLPGRAHNAACAVTV